MSVNIYEQDDIVEVKQVLTDHMDMYDNSTSSSLSRTSGGDVRTRQRGPRERRYKLATMSLALLCALLLVTIIGLCIKSSTERNELQAITAHLTQTSEQLQSNNANLTRERDESRASETIVSKEKDQLERDYEDLIRQRDQLNASFISTSKEKDQLQSSYSVLSKDKDELQTSYNTLVKERDQLNNTYIRTNAEKIQLQTNYNTLSKDMEHLHTSYNELRRDQESLNRSYTNLENEKDGIKRGLLQLGWRYFSSHLYYVSAVNKSWHDARQDCRTRGADLVIINSQEEQEFVSSINKEAWIGLSDINTEGEWRWVDGSPLITKFWAKDQPNSYKGEQDCVKLWLTPPLENWNDEKCSIIHTWICEKQIS
ncbi:hypothetical protein ACEWY4_006874 [Coilia grayii]|uniref:C-type lectin domain-containing protein n=1 Tax=Coilia grayii TaxID=363190 RepID=A0ABD1KEZ5_9TELE